MPIFSGSTSTSATSTAYNNPVYITSFNISNKTGGGITVNASVLSGSTNILITPYNHPLNANTSYESDRKILLPAGDVIYVLVSDNADYYFTLEEID